MSSSNRNCLLLSAGLLACIYIAGKVSAAAPDTSGKIVLANLDRYELSLRFGDKLRDIKPNKASILNPKKYPVTIEYWSGNTKAAWIKKTITAEGMYGFNFKRGNWEVTPLKPGKTTRPATAPAVTKSAPAAKSAAAAKPGAVGQRTARRLPMRRPINADRRRWSPLARVAWVARSLYQIVRDEQDRDLLRRLLIERREDDIKEFERWLDESDLIEIAHKEEIKEAFEDLADLTDQEWKEIDTADVEDWETAKAEIGDLISDSDWNNMTGDLSDIDSSEFWDDNFEVDLDQLDFADNLDVDGDGDIDVGDGADLAENIDIGDVGITADNFDLGPFDDFGGGAIARGIGNFASGVEQPLGQPLVGDPIGGDLGGGFGGDLGGDLRGGFGGDLGGGFSGDLGGGFGGDLGGGFGGGFFPDNDMGDFGGAGDFDFGGGDDFGGDFGDF